ncbi:unnamed protein product [Camellia sinensis]
MISHKIYICSGWTYCCPVLPSTVGIGAARKLIPCAGKEICRVCQISIQLMTSMSFGYRAFCGEEIKRGIKSGNITPDASNIRFSDKVLDEQKHAIKISDEKVALAVPAYELTMEHFIDLVFTSVVDAQVQQLDQYLKKFDEELQCERESAATTGSAAQNLKNNVKATSGRGRCKTVLLKETMGFDPLISILKLRGSSYSFTQQKTINLLSALETVGLLIMGGPEIDTGKMSIGLLTCTEAFYLYEALRCIGDLIASHTKNLDVLASKVLEEEPQVEPALNFILRIILRTSSMQEFVAADYVFKCFCKKNPDGQAMLASTSIPQPQPTTHALPEDVRTCHLEECSEVRTCSRAASVLSHVLKDNMQCKERVLRIKFEEPTPSLGAPEPLLYCVVKYLALVSCMKSKEGKLNASGNTYVQAIILKLLVIWHSNCPSVVQCFLDSRPHLTYLLELVSNSTTTVCIRGLIAVILGECVIYNKSSDSGKDAYTIVDATSQKVGLTSYFLKFEEMQKSIIFSSAKPAEPQKPLTRSTVASIAEIEDVEENKASDLKNEDHPMLASMFDAQFVDFIRNLEADIRESIVDVYSHPKSNVAVVSAELQQKGWESDGDYVKRLKSFVEKQCSEITWGLRKSPVGDTPYRSSRGKIGRGGSSQPEHRSSGGSERVQLETLHIDLQEASQRLDTLKTEKTKIESEASMYCNLAGKMKSYLKSLSDAYNNLEQANFHLEKEIKALKSGGATRIPDVKTVKAEAWEEAQKESEAELNDLLVCLGQEQS